MITFIQKCERILILTLVVMMAAVLFLATIELLWVLVKDVISPPYFVLEIDELLEIFGLFMLVLIGIELLETIVKTYIQHAVDHTRIVMAVAIIAISRKVIVLDVDADGYRVLLGIAALVLALCIGYFLLSYRSRREDKADG